MNKIRAFQACTLCTSKVPVQDYSSGAIPAANDNDPRGPVTVIIPDDDVLLNPIAIHRFAIALQNQSLSRRSVANFILDVVYGYRGLILNADRTVFCICRMDVDDAFNDDGTYRWVSDFLRFTMAPPKQRAQRRILKRLQLIALALIIDDPKLMGHILR
jgi:hypothetical protein